MQEKTSDIYVDELTGVGNRRFLDYIKLDVLPSIHSKEGVFSVIVTDLDHFKEINDTYGHLKGDEAIRFFGNFLKSNLRESDIIVRYGGDEFVIIQPGISRKEAFIVWDRIIDKLKNTNFDGLKLSASAGIASYPEDGKNFEDLFKKADERLYNAKRQGRGRVATEDTLRKVQIPCVKHVNRADAKDTLKSSIENGEIAVVRGEAGIGKTRLIKEVLSSIKGMDVLFSDCLALERKIAYYVVRELVKYRLKRQNDDILKSMPNALKIEIGKIIPGLFDVTGIIGDAMIDRYRLYEALRYVIEFGDRPKIVVIDNIQWIDEDSAEAIKYMARMDKGGKIRFVFALRDEERNDIAERLIIDISREKKVDVVALSPMESSHIKEMVRIMINDSLYELENYVAEKSSGNPFYAEELLSALYNEGYLFTRNNKWEFKEPGKDVLPRSIEDVVRRKFALLSEEGKDLLKVLSVAVKGYLDLLVAITGYNESHVFGLIEEALRFGLIKENEDYEYIEFKSELIRNVIYNSEISKLKRRMLHRKVAEWIEANIPEGMEEDLAYHYYMQQNSEKVIEYGEKAGDKLKSIYATRESLKYYRWVLESLRGKEDLEHLRKKAHILIKIAEVSRHIGDYRGSKDYYTEAIEISDKEKFYDVLVTAYNGLAWTEQILGEVEEARKNAETALRLAREYGYHTEQIGAYNTLGITYRDTRDREKTFKMYEKALEISRKAGKIANEAIILNNMAIYLHEQGEYDEALKYYEMAKSLSEKNGLQSQTAMIIYNMALVYIDKGKNDRAEELLKKAITLAREIGYRRIEASALWAFGYQKFINGEFKRSQEFLEDALSMFHGINDLRMTGVTYSTLGAVEKALGLYREAFNSHRKSLSIFQQIGGGINAIVEHIAAGKILLLLGDFKESEIHFSEALKMSKELNSPRYEIQSLIGFAELYCEKEEYEKAKEYLEEAKHKFEINESGVNQEQFNILVTEYDILSAIGEYGKLPALIEKMRKSLLTSYTLENKIILSIYECDAQIRNDKIQECQKKILELERELSMFPHAAYLAEFAYIKWKLSLLGDFEDESKRYETVINAFSNLGFYPRVERIKKERLKMKHT